MHVKNWFVKHVGQSSCYTLQKLKLINMLCFACTNFTAYTLLVYAAVCRVWVRILTRKCAVWVPWLNE